MQIPVGNWGGVDLVVDQSIGERDSHLWDLWSGSNDRKPFPGVRLVAYHVVCYTVKDFILYRRELL